MKRSGFSIQINAEKGSRPSGSPLPFSPTDRLDFFKVIAPVGVRDLPGFSRRCEIDNSVIDWQKY